MQAHFLHWTNRVRTEQVLEERDEGIFDSTQEDLSRISFDTECANLFQNNPSRGASARGLLPLNLCLSKSVLVMAFWS